MADDAGDIGSEGVATADPTPEAAEATPGESPEESPNSWDETMASVEDEMLSDLADEAPEAETPEEGETEPEGEPEAEPDADTEETPEGEAPEAPEGEAEEADEGEAPEAPEPRTDFERFELVAGDEDAEVGLEWPDDVSLRFKADDEVHEVSDPEELVEMAQKGVNYGRRSRDLAERERRAEQVVEEHREALQTAEDLLIQAVFDEERREEMAERLEPYRDPEVREAKRDAEKYRQLQDESEDEGQQQAAEEFWQQVDDDIEGHLDEFEFIDESDMSLIRQQYWGLYEAAVDELRPHAAQAVQAGDASEEEAQEWVRRRAAAVLDEDNLLAVMETLDQHYADKVQPRQRDEEDTSEPDTSETDPEDEARDHNEYVESKKRKSREGAPVKGGGGSSIPSGGGSGPEDEGPVTFEERMDDMMATLEAEKE